MLCSDDDRTRDCLKEECQDCGISNLEAPYFEAWKSAPPDMLFSYRSIEKDENGRLGVHVKKDRPPEEFVTHLKDNLSGFPLHRFLAKNQKEEFNRHLQNLTPGHLVLTSDFAEKYKIQENEEIQSLHWHSKSLTLFTCLGQFVTFDSVAGKYKKIKLYFGFFSERPDQDHFFAAHCHERIILWLKETFNQTFRTITLASDRCGAQFVNRKVFGALAESRRKFCVDHEGSGPVCPRCPQIILTYTASGHGKNEVDHAGALLKTTIRNEELHNRMLRTITEVGDYLQTINFVNLNKTPTGSVGRRVTGSRWSGAR